MKQTILLICSNSQHVIAVNETPCQHQFLVTASLVFAISFHEKKNYIHMITAIISKMRGYHLEVFVGELSKCG